MAMPAAVKHLLIASGLLGAMWVSGFIVDTIRIVPWLNKSVPACHKLWVGNICRRVLP
jgi:hypothetical protein